MTTAVLDRTPYATVPKLWPGETVVCIATGPSLTAADVDYVKGKARVIAVNDAYRLAPWADVLFAADGRWWKWHHGVPSFTGLKYGVTGLLITQQGKGNRKKYERVPLQSMYPDVGVLKNSGPSGLETDPSKVKAGRNSGYMAINVAVHFGATKIILLGYDMHAEQGKPSHFFGEHPVATTSSYEVFRHRFDSLVEPLKKRGITVINCTRRSALKAFPQQPLREVLREA